MPPTSTLHERRSGTMSPFLSVLLRLIALIYVLLTISLPLSSTVVRAEPATSSSTSSPPPEEPAYLRADADWGSYYDPQGEFCGDKDCYKILGFDYEMFGRSPPDRKEITKRYRALGRAWHPDKTKKKGAKERFVKINKAYEILTDPEKRKEYDYLRDRPDEYFVKYGSSVLWSYAPKSDARFIIFLFLILGSAFTYYAQKAKWQQIADRLTKAAVEGLSVRDGGSIESVEIRERALEILAKKEEEEKAAAAAVEANGSATPAKKKGPKLTGKEKKLRHQESLRPIVVELVKEEHKDFGGGFHQPTYRDLLVVKLVKMPFAIVKFVLWRTKYAIRRLRKLELNDEEKEVLTKSAVGEVGWAAAEKDGEIEELLAAEVWISENLENWRDMQETKNMSKGDQKRAARWKKRQGSKLD